MQGGQVMIPVTIPSNVSPPCNHPGPGLCEPAERRAERDQLGPQQRPRHQCALPLALLRPVVLPPLQHPPGRPRPPPLIPVGEY